MCEQRAKDDEPQPRMLYFIEIIVPQVDFVLFYRSIVARLFVAVRLRLIAGMLC